MKLKSLLKETKVWERKFGESLPTLEDTTKAYKLKLEQEQFKAKSKETGRVVVYKSKDAMDKAIKGGTAEPLDKKTSDKTDSGKPEKVKGQDLFKKDKPKSTSSPVKVSKQATKKVSDLSNKIEKNIDDAYEDLDSDKRDDFASTLQFIGTTLEDEIDYDNLSKEDKKEFDEIFGDIEDQVMHLQSDELGMGSIEGDPREVSKRAVKFINKFSTKKDKPVDSKPKTPTFVNDDGDVVANDFDSALELAGNLGMSEEELEYIEKEKDSEALGDYLDGHGYSQKESEWSEEDEEGYITNLKTGEREYVRENKIKLKSLLKETKVWERKFGEPLPTFSSVMEKHSGKKIDEQGILSKRAGINVFGDKKLELIAKSLINTAKDLHHTAKRKDEKNFDDVLSRITISLGVIRSYLNKPKRSM